MGCGARFRVPHLRKTLNAAKSPLQSALWDVAHASGFRRKASERERERERESERERERERGRERETQRERERERERETQRERERERERDTEERERDRASERASERGRERERERETNERERAYSDKFGCTPVVVPELSEPWGLLSSCLHARSNCIRVCPS